VNPSPELSIISVTHPLLLLLLLLLLPLLLLLLLPLPLPLLPLLPRVPEDHARA
jgi:hypothetical protein